MAIDVEIAAEQRLEQVIAVFDELFASEFNTRLLGGVAEPLYIPAGAEPTYIPAGHAAADNQQDSSLRDICDYHRLYFRENYFSSALHESAHWCIAGAERRLKMDFGYWYNPDGRSPEQQQIFEKAETQPQALEWMFSVASGQKFRISADNLAADMGASEDFIQAVSQQAQDWCTTPMPIRAEQFLTALAEQFGQSNIRCADKYQQTVLSQ